MKLQIDKGTGNIVNIQNEEYKSNDNFIPITSYASDIDMKDVETNQAWKFKIVDGELQYDQDKIKAKLDKEIQDKRRARYMTEVDPYKLEAMDDDLTEDERDKLKNIAKANKLKIKQELPKK